jgi:hypothetical protein
MIELTIDISGAKRGLAEIESNITIASYRGLQAAAERVLLRLQRNMSGAIIQSRTGRLRAQTTIKYFLQNGMMAASIKTRGNRAFIARFLENGTKYIKPRHVFEITWRSIQRDAQLIFDIVFSEEFRRLNK